MINSTWQPSANIYALKLRAEILAKIREFFAIRKVMEVETPLLMTTTVTTPHIESIPVTYRKNIFYLQTSPEYAMKRLLAAGSGPIYQICKAFRAEECGRLHSPEFTMLEWYRPGFTHRDLMLEVDSLLRRVLNCELANSVSYQEIFEEYCGLNPLTADVASLRACAQQHELPIHQPEMIDDVDMWLQLLMAHLIEPHLGHHNQPTFVVDYPITQAALAKADPLNPQVAQRFEVYWKGIELANGFHELCDPVEQRKRFEMDNAQRQQMGLSAIALDEFFLAALEHGLPSCAGVALGVDRLIMAAAQAHRLDEVIAFSFL